MVKIQKETNLEKNYNLMVNTVKLMVEEDDIIAILSNVSAVLNIYLENINWVGFYIMKKGELVLGPFQGNPACVKIAVGKGVCGTAVSKKEIMLVEDVHKFEGHIACDSASNSEIVLPIYNGNDVYGVLDIDSPKFSRFTEVEKKYLEQVANIISTKISEM